MRRGVQRAALVVVAACAVQGIPAARWVGEALAQGDACRVELTVDQPTEGAEVSARQRIAGWAVDRTASDGTGIEAVRVALDPAPSGDDQLYMPLVYGTPRADVAYRLGNPRFTTSGFAQDWAAVGTPPGRHRLVVQAKSACGWTSVTRTVRITATPPGADTIQEMPARLPIDDIVPLPIVPPTGPATGRAAMDRTPPVPVAVTRPHFALNASVAGPNSATLSWDAVPGAARYNVYGADEATPDVGQGTGRASAPRTFGVNGLQRLRNGITETSVTLPGLNAGDPYRFTVRAVSESGNELVASDVARVTLPAGGSTTLNASVANGTVSLSWDAVPGAATYAVQAASASGSMVPDPDRGNLTGTSASIDRLSPGTYNFQIDARDAAGGRIAQSNRAQAVIDGPGGAASALASTANAAPPAVAAPGMGPGGVGALGMGPGAIAPPGMGPSGAIPPPGGAPGAMAPFSGAPPVVGPGLVGPPGTVGALPGALPSGLAVSPMAGPGGVPGAAYGMPGAAGGTSGGFPLNLTRAGTDGARLEWAPVPGAASYAVYQSQGSTPLAFAYATDRPNTTLTGLTNPSGYSFQIRARNAADAEIGTSATVALPPAQ